MECLICGFNGELPIIVAESGFKNVYNNPIVRYTCPACNVIFGPLDWISLPKEQLGQKYVDVYNAGWREADSTGPEWDAFSALSPEVGKRYLNWGAGSSCKTSILAKEHNLDLTDYDPFDTNPKNSNIISGLYDGLFSNNVIEHLQNPITDLLNMRKFLKPNSKMVHATGCYSYVAELSPFHLFFLCGRSLGIVSEKIGMRSRFVSDRIVLFE